MCIAKSAESSNHKDDSESDDNSNQRLRKSQQDSLDRLDRLNVVINKLREVREQRKNFLLGLRNEMEKEDKDAVVSGQVDIDVLGEFQGSEVNLMSAIKKKLDVRYGKLVCMTDIYI